MGVETRSGLLPDLQVSTIRSAQEMAALAPEWEELWESCPHATPFQHPGWGRAWWKSFGAGKELAVIALRERGRLAGVAPLCFLNEERRKCMFLGAGLSDSMDLLVKDEFRSRLGLALFAWLEEEDWSLCDLQPLPPDSWLLEGAGSLGSLGWRHLVDPLLPNTILHLPGCWEEFQQRYSPHFRKRLRNALHKLAGFGEVCFHQTRGCAAEGELEVLLGFRRNTWDRNLGEQEWNQLKGFFLEALDGCSMPAQLMVYTLKVNREIAAGLCGFVRNKRACLYLTGFNSKYAAASPGRVLMWQCLRRLIEEGANTCDFLRGREDYKYHWGVVEVPHFSLRIHRDAHIAALSAR